MNPGLFQYDYIFPLYIEFRYLQESLVTIIHLPENRIGYLQALREWIHSDTANGAEMGARQFCDYILKYYDCMCWNYAWFSATNPQHTHEPILHAELAWSLWLLRLWPNSNNNPIPRNSELIICRTSVATTKPDDDFRKLADNKISGETRTYRSTVHEIENHTTLQ